MANVNYTPPIYPLSYEGFTFEPLEFDFSVLSAESSIEEVRNAVYNCLRKYYFEENNIRKIVDSLDRLRLLFDGTQVKTGPINGLELSDSRYSDRDRYIFISATHQGSFSSYEFATSIALRAVSYDNPNDENISISLTPRYWSVDIVRPDGSTASQNLVAPIGGGQAYAYDIMYIVRSGVRELFRVTENKKTEKSFSFNNIIVSFTNPKYSKWTPESYEFTQKELRTKADTEYYIVKGFSGQLSYSDDPDNYQDDDFEPSSVFLLHDPWINDKAVLSSMVINWESNASGSFEFTIPLTNPAVDTIKYGSYIQITVLDHEPVNNPLVTNEDIGDLVWFGRVINVEVDKFKNTKVVAEGPACFVKDYNLGVFCTNQQSVGFSASDTLEDAFKTLLTASTPIGQITQISRGVYNTDYHRPPFLYMSPEDFELYNTRSPFLQPDYPINRLTDIFAANDYGIIFLNKAGEYTMYDFLIELMQYQGFNTEPGKDEDKYGYRAITVVPWCDTNEADIPADRPIVTRIFTRLTDTSHSYFTSKQKIIFAENLSDAKIEADYENMGTSICFLGAEVELDGFGDYKARYGFSGLETGGQPVEENGEGTIIGSYINSTGGYIREYGLVSKTVIIDSLTSSRAVADYALAHRDDYANPIYKFSISAADLGKVYKGEDSIVLEDLVEVHFPAMPYDDYDEYICTKIKEDLLNPSQSTYEFERATTNMNGRSYRSIRTLSKELDSAKKTISRLEQEVNKLKKGEE